MVRVLVLNTASVNDKPVKRMTGGIDILLTQIAFVTPH